MNHFGKDLKLIAHIKSSTPQMWPLFFLWYTTHKNLPDITLYLLFERKDFLTNIIPSFVQTQKIKVLYCEFNDDLDFLIKNSKNEFFNNSIFIDSFVYPIDVLNDKIMDCFKNNINLEDDFAYVVSNINNNFNKDQIVTNSELKTSSSFISIKEGWGNFIMSTWINKKDNPLVYDFKNNRMTHDEMNLSVHWSDAGKISNLFF
jgi:hypothetical protein